MPIDVPTLAGTRLESLSARAHFKKSDAAVVSYLEKFKDPTYLWAAVDQDTSIQLAVDEIEDGDDWHCHVNLFSTSYRERPSVIDDTIDELTIVLDWFVGCKTDVTFGGRFSLDRSKMPAKGLVDGFDGISTEVSGARLTMTGAEMTIEGSPFYSLRWNVIGKRVDGSLAAHISEFEITAGYLDTGIAQIEQGIDTLLLEKRKQE
jgi:hypothetical protein